MPRDEPTEMKEEELLNFIACWVAELCLPFSNFHPQWQTLILDIDLASNTGSRSSSVQKLKIPKLVKTSQVNKVFRPATGLQKLKVWGNDMQKISTLTMLHFLKTTKPRGCAHTDSHGFVFRVLFNFAGKSCHCLACFSKALCTAVAAKSYW